MRRRLIVVLAIVLGVVVAIPDTPVWAQDTANPACPLLFRQYDLAERAFGPNSRRSNALAPRSVVEAAYRLRRADCLTFSAAIAGLEVPPPVADQTLRNAGAAAIPPMSLHVGIVTSTEDDARARAFFERHGLRARSVGAALLGRRVYVGPFQSRNALDAAATLAVRAGFAYPYPARF